MSEQPTSILINLMGSLGDVARGLTLVAPLKSAYPKVEITWLVEPKCFELVSLHPAVNRIIVFQRGKGVASIIKLCKELRAKKYDLCLDLQRHLKSGLFSRISGSKRILGFNKKDAKEFNWLFTTETIEAFPKDLPKVEHYWKFLEFLGIPSPQTGEVPLVVDHTKIEKFGIDQNCKYILLVLGSSWQSKDWPISGYHRLLEELSSQLPDINFLMTGGVEHRDIADKLYKTNPQLQSKLIKVCGKSSLEELCAMVKNAQVVIGPDSGPGHLAALFAVPFVGLFGPTDASRTAPIGENVVILSSKIGCSPCYRRECPGLDKLCMRLIDPKRVADTILQVI